jgi:neutral ceramidase
MSTRLPGYHNSRLKIWFIQSVFLIIIIFEGCRNAPVNFEAGAGIAEITPPEAYRMYRGPSTGVNDPLYARALVMEQDGTAGAIVVCDLIGIQRNLSRIVRKEASKKTGIPFSNITITASHTHTGPVITGEFVEYADRYDSGKLTEADRDHYFTALVNSITEAIVSAFNKKEPVEIIPGKGTLENMSFNRRYLMTDGRVRFNPGVKSQIVRPTGPVDPGVHFIMFKPAGSKNYSASFSNFAIHSDTRGGTKFSADYLYYLHENLKEYFGEQLISIFGIGPCGNINHVNAMGENKRNDNISHTENIGRSIAATIKNSVTALKPGKPELKIVSKTIYVPIQDYTDNELTWAKEGKEPLYPERSFLEYRRRLKIIDWVVQAPLEHLRKRETIQPSVSGDPWRLPVEIHVFKLDDNTAIVTMPGELFSEFSLDLKKRSPFSNTMLIELANAEIAYVPTIQAFREGDYEAINSRLVPGSGEKMIDTAIEILEELKKNN